MTEPRDEALAAQLGALEARLSRLEASEERLRNFVVPAFWDVLDRLYENTPSRQRPRCLACDAGGPLTRFHHRRDSCIFGGGALVRLECPRCGCVFGPLKYLQTPDRIVEADYRLLYQHYSEGDSTEAELRAFELLQPRADGLYLNWGSGAWSSTVEQLRARGFDVWGFEPNAPPDSSFVLRSREEITSRFDGIFSNNVIEHLFEPAAAFRDFAGLLKPGGRMTHASPCYSWSYAFTRFHVFFPLGRAAEALAKRTGFKIVETVEDGDFQARVFEADA